MSKRLLELPVTLAFIAVLPAARNPADPEPSGPSGTSALLSAGHWAVRKRFDGPVFRAPYITSGFP